MVTAEIATVAPFVLAFTLLLVWMISLGLTQVRLTDSAREAARLVARGEPVSQAESVARRQSPRGTTVQVEVADGVATVQVRTRSRMPLPFFSGIGSRTVKARAVAVLESP